MLDDTFANAMVLAFTNSGQVAKALIGRLIKLFQLFQRLLTNSSKFALLGSLSQRVQHTLITIVADEPARAMTSIVGKVEGDVTGRSCCILEVRQLTVVVHIVRTCQPRIGLDVITCCLGCHGGYGNHQEQQGKQFLHLRRAML